MKKARVRERNSNLKVDMKIFEEKRKEFERENRRMRRSFSRRTEELLERYPPKKITEAINKDRRRRE